MRVRLIHANPDEARARAKSLRAAGHRIQYDVITNAAALKVVAASPPDVIVIDLDRMTSFGRDTGVLLRQRRATRHVPLVFAGGEQAKVARVRQLLPDATYCSWRGIRGALKAAVAKPAAAPRQPHSIMDAYARRPLAAKLGIAPGMRLYLHSAPPGFEATVGKLPSGAAFTRRALVPDLTIWFVHAAAQLANFPDIAARAGEGRLWIAWPKGAEGLTQAAVRRIGMDAGWVDHKICRIDPTWAALLFSRRKAKRR